MMKYACESLHAQGKTAFHVLISLLSWLVCAMSPARNNELAQRNKDLEALQGACLSLLAGHCQLLFCS